MVNPFFVPVYAAGALIGLAHFFSERINDRCHGYQRQLASFAAGISISFLFLELFPLLSKGIAEVGTSLFLSVLIGFVALHSIERHVREHEDPDVLAWELKEIHSVAFFLFHLLVGVILLELADREPFVMALFILPLLLKNIFSPFSMERVHSHMREQKILKIVLSLSTLIGTVVATLIFIPSSLFYLLLGFVMGTLLYVIVRDHMPRRQEGALPFFIIGVIVYTFTILSTWPFVHG